METDFLLMFQSILELDQIFVPYLVHERHHWILFRIILDRSKGSFRSVVVEVFDSKYHEIEEMFAENSLSLGCPFENEAVQGKPVIFQQYATAIRQIKFYLFLSRFDFNFRQALEFHDSYIQAKKTKKFETTLSEKPWQMIVCRCPQQVITKNSLSRELTFPGERY